MALNWDIDLSTSDGWADLCGYWHGMAKCLAAAIRTEHPDVMAAVLENYDQCEDMMAFLLATRATYKADSDRQ